jgi:hypothetical protein
MRLQTFLARSVRITGADAYIPVLRTSLASLVPSSQIVADTEVTGDGTLLAPESLARIGALHLEHLTERWQPAHESLLATRPADVPRTLHRCALEPSDAYGAAMHALCVCRPGWEAKARPRVRSSTHSSQKLVSATCQPLQWSRSSAENSSPRARPPDYDESSARRDHQASAAVIALSASWMPSPTSPAVAAQCRGTRARAPGSQRCSSRVSGSGAVPS